MKKIKEFILEPTIFLDSPFKKVIYLLGWFFFAAILSGLVYYILLII